MKTSQLKKIIKWFSLVVLITIVLMLIGWTAAFFAIRYGWTNVSGEADRNAKVYTQALPIERIFLPQASTSSIGILVDNLTTTTVCQLLVIDQAGYDSSAKAWQTVVVQPDLGWRFLTAASLSQWLSYRSGQEAAADESLKKCLISLPDKNEALSNLNSTAKRKLFTWQTGEEWSVIEKALIKDKTVIEKAAEAAGVKPRILVSAAIVEQLRLYYTQRELFEKFFKPLNILASANKMAWGVMAIKEKTAIATEDHLRDSNSAFYLGPDKETLLDLPTGNQTDIRYQRLTNEKDHYYSYLYGGLYLAQVIEQWSSAGYDISSRPEILVTLFNIGFNNSKPKDNPQVGGSKITIGGRDYSFGGLGYEFYYSDALVKEFPY
ncbi:MAG TPA: hypothetical protein PKN62_01655 [bacterium]|nr:hypothetical protein [bacterium]